jgi:hypothetical protein
MSSIALVGALAGVSSQVTRMTAALVERGHTVTYFQEGTVTDSNLSSYDVIFCFYNVNITNLVGYLEGYMTDDSIPVVVGYSNQVNPTSNALANQLGLVATLRNDPLGGADVGDLTFASTHRDQEITDAFYGDEVLRLWDGATNQPNVAASSKTEVAGTILMRNPDGLPVMSCQDEGGARITKLDDTFDTRVVWIGWGMTEAVPVKYGVVLFGIAVEWAVGDYESLVYPL